MKRCEAEEPKVLGIYGIIQNNGYLSWELVDPHYLQPDEGLQVSISLRSRFGHRDALELIKKSLEKNDVCWLIPHRSIWQIDVKLLRTFLETHKMLSYLSSVDWLQGIVSVSPEVEYGEETFAKGTELETAEDATYVRLRIYKEEFFMDNRTKIFLSHKGADKPLARRLSATLKELGFDPWLDEEAMAAGVELHRGIKDGFKVSCAAVFLITPSFHDEKYLRSEVNYAIEEKTAKGDKFAIVTLVVQDQSGKKGHVP